MGPKPVISNIRQNWFLNLIRELYVIYIEELNCRFDSTLFPKRAAIPDKNRIKGAGKGTGANEL